MADESLVIRERQRRRQVDALALSFGEGLLVPWWLLLAKEAVFLWIYHREDLRAAWQAAPDVLRRLVELRQRDPELFDRLVKNLVTEAGAAIPDVVDEEAWAFLAGRLVRTELRERGRALERQVLALLETGAIVLLVHLPGLLLAGLELSALRTLRETAGDLQGELLDLIQREAELLQPLVRRLAGPGGVT